MIKLLKIAVAVVQDVATLGGVINDAYFHNGRRSYTAKAIDDMLNG